ALRHPDAAGHDGQDQADLAQAADIVGLEGIAQGQGSENLSQTAQDHQEAAEIGGDGPDAEQQQGTGQRHLTTIGAVADGHVQIVDGNEDGGDPEQQQHAGDQGQQDIGDVQRDLQQAGDGTRAQCL